MKIPEKCSNMACKEKAIGIFWIYTKSFPDDDGKLYCSQVAMCQKDFDKQNDQKAVESIDKLKRGVKITLNRGMYA